LRNEHSAEWWSLPVEPDTAATIKPDAREVKRSPLAGLWSWAGLFLAGFGAVAGTVNDDAEQIDEDEDVDGEEADANPGDVTEDLEELPGQERGGDGEGEVLAPGLFKIEADAFDHGEGGVQIREKADAAENRVVDERGFLEDKSDQARLGIEAEMAGEEVDLIGDVSVEEAMGADADGDEEKSMEEFIDRDGEQQRIAAMAADTG
jgi:hypothetical protein